MSKLPPYTSLDEQLYSFVSPSPLSEPSAGHFNLALVKKLGLDVDFWQQNWVSIISGNMELPNSKPIAMAYAGHQFGVWAGQLGDGRGLLLEQINQNNKLWDLHLKGAGQTPYSRSGDGRAVLRSTIREYLAGHALNQLGIASSNSLGFVCSKTTVRRESIETAACMIRVADTHIRLGHFEWINAFAPQLLEDFTNYVIHTYYPTAENAEQPIAEFAKQVIANTAKTIADWQLFGFAHGVMNTDNLSITGSTLDFGPFGFMQRFQPDWINNHSDYQGRYTYQNQPAIAHWNLSVWLSQLLPLQKQHTYINKAFLAKLLDEFESVFLIHYQQGITNKLGLNNDKNSFKWCMELLNYMRASKLDYTNTFRIFTDNICSNTTQNIYKDLSNEITRTELLDNLKKLLTEYEQLLATNPIKDRVAIMTASNPIYILRNEMAQKAIEQAETGDFAEVNRLFDLLNNPFNKQNIAEEADTTPPSHDAPDLMISCSS